MTTSDFVAALDGEDGVDDIELDLFPEAADQLGDVEALPSLMTSDNRPTALVRHIGASLLLGRVANLVRVGFAAVDVDGLVVRRASCRRAIV